MSQPPTNDRRVVGVIVGAIVFGFVFAMLTTTVFAWQGKEAPAPITHLLDVAIGSIATILAQTRTASGNDTDK